VVFEDNYLIVVNKPSGLLTIPTPKGETDTLTHLLNKRLDELKVEVNAYPCHRIDRETSGLIVYAKGKSIQARVMEEFKKRRVKKTYIAFVHGIVRKDFDTLKSYVYNKDKKKNDLMITRFRVIERRGDFSVLELEPVTGRKNQIRIQFRDLGHPLVGESVYAFRKDFKLRFKRTALHAKAIEFAHPVTGKRVRFVLPLPEDMENFLKR